MGTNIQNKSRKITEYHSMKKASDGVLDESHIQESYTWLLTENHTRSKKARHFI